MSCLRAMHGSKIYTVPPSRLITGSQLIMKISFPKNDAKYHWTNHVGMKMLYYGLSADRIKRVIRNPKRSEKGIAPNTIAVMQPGKAIVGPMGKPPTWKEEIWVMYATAKPSRVKSSSSLKVESLMPKKKVIITAWRYPGRSPIRETIPIPNDILEELKSIKY